MAGGRASDEKIADGNRAIPGVHPDPHAPAVRYPAIIPAWLSKKEPGTFRNHSSNTAVIRIYRRQHPVSSLGGQHYDGTLGDPRTARNPLGNILVFRRNIAIYDCVAGYV